MADVIYFRLTRNTFYMGTSEPEYLRYGAFKGFNETPSIPPPNKAKSRPAWTFLWDGSGIEGSTSELHAIWTRCRSR